MRKNGLVLFLAVAFMAVLSVLGILKENSNSKEQIAQAEIESQKEADITDNMFIETKDDVWLLGGVEICFH